MAVSGISFILSVLGTTFLLVLGLLDRWIYQPIVMRTMHQIHLAMGVLWMGIGVMTFLSWWRYKKDKDLNRFLLAFPKFSSEPEKDRPVPKRSPIFIPVVLGCMFAFLSSIWPQDQNIYIVSYFFVTAGHPGLALATFFFYSLAFVIPLLLIWLVLMRLTSPKAHPWLAKSVSYIKLVFSAVFLAVGIGEVCLFFNNLL